MSSDGEDGRDGKPVVEVHPGKEVVVDFDPSLTFECVDECTWCCHRGVRLHAEDLRELGVHEDVAAATTERGGHASVRREPKDREEFVDVDGEACFFLGDDGLCALQVDHDWKPTRCSVFPLHVTVADGDLHVGVRDDATRHCDGLGVSERRVIDHLDAFLPPLLWDLDDPDTDRIPGV